jgi:hypothetical protein
MVILFILLFGALCVKIGPDTHKGMNLVFVLKLGVKKVVIGVVLTVWTFLRTYSLQNYF